MLRARMGGVTSSSERQKTTFRAAWFAHKILGGSISSAVTTTKSSKASHTRRQIDRTPSPAGQKKRGEEGCKRKERG
eukprot:1572212-Rhodomonas_salina.1